MSFRRPLSSSRLAAVAATLSLLAGGLVLSGCGQSSNDKRPVAAATAPQLEGLLQALAGRGVRVAPVVPATADLHEVELRPSQVRALRDASLVIRPGRKNDTWADEALSRIDARQVDASQGIAGAELHWWMDPMATASAAVTVAEALDRIDPKGAPQRRIAMRHLRAQLLKIDVDTQTCLASVPASARRIVTDHDAAGAFAQRYGLTVVGTISPGSEPEAAPSAERVAQLEDTMQRQHVRALFPIAPHGSALARTIAQRGGAVLGAPLWADALPPQPRGAVAADALQDAARRNAVSVAAALGARSSACRALRD